MYWSRAWRDDGQLGAGAWVAMAVCSRSRAALSCFADGIAPSRGGVVHAAGGQTGAVGRDGGRRDVSSYILR